MEVSGQVDATAALSSALNRQKFYPDSCREHKWRIYKNLKNLSPFDVILTVHRC